MLGVTWQLFQRVPLTPACCKLQHKHIPENAPDFGIHLLWQHRGVGSAARKVVCFLTPCINTSGCHCPGAATGPVLASKGAADLPELACVSSQCGRLGTAAGCGALPLQLSLTGLWCQSPHLKSKDHLQNAQPLQCFRSQCPTLYFAFVRLL